MWVEGTCSTEYARDLVRGSFTNAIVTTHQRHIRRKPCTRGRLRTSSSIVDPLRSRKNTVALKTFGAFAAGVVVGWTGRSVFGSTRELMVQAFVAAHYLEGQAKRIVAERFEWAEDMFAEGRARYRAEAGHEGHSGDPSAYPDTHLEEGAEVAAGRGRAA
jgi:hypothetical protein